MSNDELLAVSSFVIRASSFASGHGAPVETLAAMSSAKRLLPRPGSETRSVIRPRGMRPGQSQRMLSGASWEKRMAPAICSAWASGLVINMLGTPGAIFIVFTRTLYRAGRERQVAKKATSTIGLFGEGIEPRRTRRKKWDEQMT